MANFDLIEYQKRVIADLTAENKALKEQMYGICRLCKYGEVSVRGYPCSKCSRFNMGDKLLWEWKGVEGK